MFMNNRDNSDNSPLKKQIANLSVSVSFTCQLSLWNFKSKIVYVPLRFITMTLPNINYVVLTFVVLIWWILTVHQLMQ